MEKRLPNEHRFTNNGTLLGQLIWIGIGSNGQIELTNISWKRIFISTIFLGSVVDSTVARVCQCKSGGRMKNASLLNRRKCQIFGQLLVTFAKTSGTACWM
jgi:hypothetical protein